MIPELLLAHLLKITYPCAIMCSQFYIMSISIHALYMAVAHFISCVGKDWKGKDTFMTYFVSNFVTYYIEMDPRKHEKNPE